MGQLNDKMQDVSKNLLALHVKQVMSKHMQGRKGAKELTDEEKENLRNLYIELEDQVNSFVQQVFNKADEDEAEEEGREEANARTRTTLRDLVRQRRNKK